MERELTKNQILSELTRSPHGKLEEYLPVGKEAVTRHPEFMAHLIAWNYQKGQIRDSKVALPVIFLSVKGPQELEENALAHLACLNPREFLRGIRFAKEQHVRKQAMHRLAEGYLRVREKNIPKWDRMALQHRAVLKELYSLMHVKPSEHANIILNGKTLDKKRAPYPAGSLFEAVARLKDMTAAEAAGTITKLGIPFLIAQGALGARAKEPDYLQALIGAMSPTELVTNAKMLERLGVKKIPALRGALAEAISKAGKSKANVLKTSQAAEAVEDEDLKENLRGLQEKQIQSLGGVEGNWLVLADKSGSMSTAIVVARHVAATLSKMVKGRVWLVFFDTSPQTIPIPEGTALDAIEAATKYITAGGGTSIGCGLQRMLDEKVEVDGIAIVSDGGENNSPYFPRVYEQYSKLFDKQVPVYLYRTEGDHDALSGAMEAVKLDMQKFELGRNIDYYSIPNLVKTMRTCRYSLVDEIMSTRLLKLSDMLPDAEAIHSKGRTTVS